jgi:hypothetical protein
MAEQTIITATDIREFYPEVSVNIDDDFIESKILLAQQNDLEPFLGYYLYNAFIEDYDGTQFTTAIYQNLFAGTSYAYRGDNRYYRGLRHLLAVYSFIRLIEISTVTLTDSGLVTKTTDESEPREDYQIRKAIMTVKDDAVRLEKDAKDFILQNIEDYKLYHKRYSTDDYKTSYNFYKV